MTVSCIVEFGCCPYLPVVFACLGACVLLLRLVLLPGKVTVCSKYRQECGNKVTSSWTGNAAFPFPAQMESNAKESTLSNSFILQPVEHFLFFLQSQWDKVCVCWGGRGEAGTLCHSVSSLSPGTRKGKHWVQGLTWNWKAKAHVRSQTSFSAIGCLLRRVSTRA